MAFNAKCYKAYAVANYLTCYDTYLLSIFNLTSLSLSLKQKPILSTNEGCSCCLQDGVAARRVRSEG